MKKYALFLLSNMIICHCAFGTGFLTAQKFPTTYNDVSFADRMRIEAEGYEPFESEFDNDGVCIKNCAYKGITLKEVSELSRINTENALRESLQYEQNKNNLSLDAQKILSANYKQCMYRNYAVQPGTSVPRAEPLIGTPYITSPFGQRIHPISGKDSVHDGIDYRASIGTYVYTPADGRVTKIKNDINGYGWYVVVKHPDGTSTLYAHLSDILVDVGDNVSAGCAIAKTGNSGSSTGQHLHYGIYDSRGQPIDPGRYTGRSTN